MKLKRDWIYLGIVFLIGAWGVAGLWKLPGVPTSHDSISHVARLYAYLEGIKDGIFPVLWAKRLFWGIGSPVLMLNYQLPYYFALLWHAVGLSIDNSFKAVLSFSHIMAGLLMYKTLRIKYKPLASLSGAVMYVLGPYRFLNIYVRGAMGEVFATMFPPIILAGIWKKSVSLQAVGWAGLFLSHPVGSALYSAVFLGYQLWMGKFKNILRILREFFIPYALALMIAAFNILPTLALTKYTYYRPENSNTLRNFPTFKQLVYSKWGYGFSTEDDRDEMSFQIGIIQWALAGLAVSVLISKKQKNAHSRELQYLVFVFVVAILLMIQKIATPVYIHLKMGKIIDYPWRILMIFSFLSSLIAARLVGIMDNRKIKIALASFLILGSLFTNRNHVRINAIWPWPSQSFIQGTGDAYGEYAALWRQTRLGSEFKTAADITSGKGVLEVKKDNSNSTGVIVTASEPTVLRFNIMYFPGWEVNLNGRLVPIEDKRVEIKDPESGCYVTRRNDKKLDDSGLIACHIPAGNSQVLLTYRALPVQRVGNLITLAGIGILLWQIFRSSYQPSMNGKQLSR